MKRRTKLMEAYISLTGNYGIDSVSTLLLKEELELILDHDITPAQFYEILIENTKAYHIYLLKYNPDTHFNYLVLNNQRVGEIGIELREGSPYS